IVQLPAAAKATARPDVAVALTPKSGSPNVLLASTPSAIVWLALPIVNDCGTSAAGWSLPSPGCDAVTVHAPAAVMWTVAPLIVQLPAAAKATARPDVAVALTPKSGSPNVLLASTPSAIVWLALPIVNDCGT